MNNDRHQSPAQIAWRRLRRNRIAMLAACILGILYFLAIFAGFFSPYSPTQDEFRSLFFHPPSVLHFRDETGKFHLRPYVVRTYLLNPEQLTYTSGTPLTVLYRYPAGNTNPYLPDTVEEPGVLLVRTAEGKTLAAADTVIETGPNSGVFRCSLSIDPFALGKSKQLVIRASSGESAEFPVVHQMPQHSAPDSPATISLLDENNRPVSEYQPRVERYPIRFFVHGWRYHILWIVHSDLHLFGTDEPGHVFLFGTDQSGRDLFSRMLHGAQISLTVGLVGVFLTTVFGMLYGGIAGYYGGKVDNVLMRFVEVLMSIPALYLILTLRNMIPDRMQEFYDKLHRLGSQTFAWQHSFPANWIAPLVVLLLLSYYCYRTQWRTSRLYFSGFLLSAILFGRLVARWIFQTMTWIVPPSTHLTSEWTYFLIIVILSTVTWAAMSRVIRGMVLSLKEQEYVLAARALGASDLRIILRHILPNTLGYVIVRATLLVPSLILGEVILSYLGVGVQEPIPSWGNMLSAAQNLRVLQQFHWILSPGYFLFFTVLAFNFLGDGLRDALDVRRTAD